MATVRPLIVIVGQTASGKSAVAMELAEIFNGEIICADARTVYRGMNIGTAKPSQTDRSAVKHHLLDIVNPDESFSAADFQKLASDAIDDIQFRNKLPIMVGGTGLYIDSVLFDFGFSESKERDPQNPRHALKSGDSKPLRENTLVIGIDLDKQVIDERIEKRITTMIEQGLEDEVDKLLENYEWTDPGMNAIGYREWQPFFDHEATIDDVTANILKDTRSYAKRQKTWFKRNKSIHWINSPLEAVSLTGKFLDNN